MKASPPVLLLTGPGSRRLEETALARATGILCRTGEGHSRASAESCQDCRRVFRREHPDLLIAAPESRRRANTPAGTENPASKETTIPAALVRAVAADASRLPYEGGLRAVIFLDVDKTEDAAFSALLKVLEEPPQKTRFLLTAVKPRLLPATILSRVVEEKQSVPGRKSLSAALQTEGVKESEALARAAFCPESLEEARSLDLDAARTERDSLLEALLGTVAGPSTGWALSLAARLDAGDAAATAARLNLLAVLLRDAAASSIDPAAAIHQERARELAQAGRELRPVLIQAALECLDSASLVTEARLNGRMVCETLAIRILRAVTAGA
ncbi:MAG: hypothetical protein IT186_02655 [Acidobacteria bacterium]|nr:hypothetical protein [Acidobacteriota bacterium]MCG3193346.1 hypothetical protein [Thermoanaerobaculia bacterium]